jgi:hypothetical protein
MVKNLAQQGVINLSGVRPQLAKGPTKTLQDQTQAPVNLIPVYLACVCVLRFIRWFGLSAPILPTITADNRESTVLERFPSKALRMTTDAPRYVPNTVIRKDLQSPTVKHEISRYSYHHSKRLSVHSNELILNLQEPPETRWFRKNLPIDNFKFGF